MTNTEQDLEMEQIISDRFDTYFEKEKKVANIEKWKSYGKIALCGFVGAGIVVAAKYFSDGAIDFIDPAVGEVLYIPGWVGVWQAVERTFTDKAEKEQHYKMYSELDKAEINFIYPDAQQDVRKEKNEYGQGV